MLPSLTLPRWLKWWEKLIEETISIDLAKYVVSEARLPSHAKRYFSNIIYFFLSS